MLVVLLIARQLPGTTLKRGEDKERRTTTAAQISKSLNQDLGKHQQKLEDALKQSTDQPAAE